ncbi:MAG: hypothetical protein NC417_14655 [Candidatus Gastranaerophilales bacterium]|nr:hypothetical protein [Candidatus Gastranaerophilales bacterium]
MKQKNLERILLLDNQKANGYPEAFRGADVAVPEGGDRQAYLETRILKAFNEYIPKLQLVSVEYGNIRQQFSRAKAGITSGVIVEEFEVPWESVSRLQGEGNYVFERDGRMFARRLAAYVYMPLPSAEGRVEGRNAMISQTLFPTLIDYMEEYMGSPCYTPANHPLYLVNISQKDFTAATIRRAVASLAFIGFRYIDVFKEEHARAIDLREVPKDLKLYLKQYDAHFQEYYDADTDQYESPYVRIRFGEKKFWVKKQAVEERLRFQDGVYQFHGSDEKFYWMEIYPLTVAAYDQGYQVDISEYREFCQYYGSRFAAGSEKIRRCQILLRYLEKYLLE